MEESLRELKNYFGITDTDPDKISPLTLAFLGDAVFEIAVRFILVGRYKMPVGRLHSLSSRIVCAEAQSEMIAALEPELTPQEIHIYKRGRNSKSHTMAKNASVPEYRRATGFEALLGYLFLKEDFERLTKLCEKAVSVREDPRK